MHQIKVGIIGLGTVGGGTFQLLARNAQIIAARSGCAIEISRIATRTPAKAARWSAGSDIVSSDVDALLNDPEIQVVAEMVGGVEPARTYVLRALESGKSVVTANKELIAKHGPELRAAAQKMKVDLLFEGAVGGGIPIIKALRESLAGNEIQELMGIVNGTTNFILTKMTREGADFADVLAQAQSLGYAESDPTADVDGFDAAYKLAILAGLAFDTPVDAEADILREGIRGVSSRDIEYAAELGYIIKLLAVARRDRDGKLELRVHPTLLPQSHPLAGVSDSFNAVFVRGDALGDAMFYGRGAGDGPTGSAVVGDIIEAAKNKCRGIYNAESVPSQKMKMQPFEAHQTRFCVRMQVGDAPGTIAKIAGVFGDAGVSIESIVQRHSDGTFAEIFWLTHQTTQRAMNESLFQFEELEVVREVSSVLRVEGE
ncbi:homoserine dehydrogenase [Abditibacterium utsteinense]|uniref:Homoserine dehydrogenase n=1 Tax=Abditibacterium utsteinense TaxID=1960156 RepID=A0A2S8STB2_9BACT|nr:homoserine dehydrogenase [Abditibacterium utsteinense]PQV64044.1 homoserine dehydrogenase [Abditibacterium utsteinense]